MRALAAGMTLTISVLAVGAAVASAATVTQGKGMPPWRLGRTYVQAPGLVRSQRQSSPYGVGCVPNVTAATRIDWYRGVRTAWSPGTDRKLRLFDVSTSRAGDRSADGFVIESSRRSDIRRRHPGAAAGYGKAPLSLGATSLTVLRRTAKETFTTMVYWFDARGVLTALETFTGGC